MNIRRLSFVSGFSQQIEVTVSEIFIDPPCQEGNARFTTKPLRALSDQE